MSEAKEERMDLKEKAISDKTVSGIPLKPFYTPEDVKHEDYQKEVADPGTYPFTRGVFPNGYRGRLWTRTSICGFGGPADTNKRLRYEIEAGITGISVIYDTVHTMGIDADHPMAIDEVGIAGVNLNSLEDMETMFEGIPIEKINFSSLMENSAALVNLAWYVALAEKRGIDPAVLKGSVQNDTINAYYFGFAPAIVPFELSLKCQTDVLEYCTRNMPGWYWGTINSHAWRENGLTAPQELGILFAKAAMYVENALKRGLNVDDFAPRMGFYGTVGMDFFEEIAKFRASRRMWAKIMKERYGAKNPRSLHYRFGVHTLGPPLSRMEPLNNIARIALQSMAAVLGGVHSLEARPFDETISLPTELSHRIAIATQQIIAYESGVPSVADPLGGSYYVENLTDKIEEEAWKVMRMVEDMGGIIEAMKSGWLERQFDRWFQEEQRKLDTKEKIKVGENAFTNEKIHQLEESIMPPAHTPLFASAQAQIESVKRLRRTRDNVKVKKALAGLRERAQSGWEVNLMPAVLEAVKAYATCGEVMGTIREAYGYSYDPIEGYLNMKGPQRQDSK